MTRTLGGHFRSTQSPLGRTLRHLRCVGWRKLLWKYRTMGRMILYALLGLTYLRLIRKLSTRYAGHDHFVFLGNLQYYNQVRLAETFLGIAEALRKPRGFLFATRGSKALK